MPERTSYGLSVSWLRYGVAVLLAVVSVLVLASGRANAATNNGVCGALSVPNAAGSVGTAGDPCLITSDADLDTALAQINADTAHTGASTADYELTADLDYSKDATNGGAAVGAWSGIDWFSGTFNGDGHTISNLAYTVDSSTTVMPGSPDLAGEDYGFFRVLDNATVENLTLTNVVISGGTSNISVGAVAVASFDSTVTGVSLSAPSISAPAGGGDSYVGGLVGLAYANTYADDGSTISDGGTSAFTNDSVSGGSISDANRTGGIVGMATGPTTVSDDYVDTKLSNPAHAVDGTTGQVDLYYYVIGGLVGEIGTSYTVAGGGQAAGVAMTDNVIGGTIEGDIVGSRSDAAGQNFASATVGYATTAAYSGSGTAPTASNWSTSNNLVSSSINYMNETGSGLPGADGTSVSPQTLATESTYDGTATALTDAATSSTYNDLAWDFGAADPSGWTWTVTSTSSTPTPQINAGLAVQNTTLNVLVNSDPSDATLLTDAGVSATNGTPQIDTSAVNWTTDGSYQATISVSGAIADPVTVTVVVAPSFVTLAHSTATFQATNSAPSAASVLTALGAAVLGGTGQPTVSLSGVDFDTPGNYQVTVTDNNAGDDAASVTGTIQVVPVSVVSIQHATVYFNVTDPPTPQQVQTAAGAALTDAGGDSVQGTLSTDTSQVGSTAGTYTATITATDQYGFTTQPAEVSVVISSAAIGFKTSTVTFQAGSSPTPSAVLSALGASVTGSGTGSPSVSLSGVDFNQPGSYSVTISDTNAHDVAADQTATIAVVPITIIAVSSTTVHIAVSADGTLSPSALLSAAGATLTDSYGDQVSGSLSADASAVDASTPGIYTATISGTDSYGFAAAPIPVSVVVYVPATTGGTVTIDGTAAVGATLTADTTGWSTLAPLQYQWLANGAPIAGANSATYTVRSADAGDNLTVEVTESLPSYKLADVTSAAVTIPAATNPGTGGSGTGGGSSSSGNVAGTGSGNPAGSANTSSAPSATVVKKALTNAVDSAATSASIAQIDKAKQAKLTFSAPSAGQLKLDWYAQISTKVKVHGKTETKIKKVLIGSDSTKFTGAKKGTVAVHLNAAGRRLLKGAKTLQITQQAAFTPTHSKATTVSKRFTLGGAKPEKKTAE